MGKTTVLKGGEKRGRGRPWKVPEDDGKPLKIGGQEHLPEMAPMPKNEKIHRLALRCKTGSKAWSRAAEEHKCLKQSLIEAMIEAELEHYEYGDVKVDMDTNRSLKVKVANDDDEGDE